MKVTDGAEDRHVVDNDSLSVPQQAEGFTAEHCPVQLVPPFGHTGGRAAWWKKRHFCFGPSRFQKNKVTSVFFFENECN